MTPPPAFALLKVFESKLRSPLFKRRKDENRDVELLESVVGEEGRGGEEAEDDLPPPVPRLAHQPAERLHRAQLSPRPASHSHRCRQDEKNLPFQLANITKL